MKRASIVGLLTACGLTACGGANAALPSGAGNIVSAAAAIPLANTAAPSNVVVAPASLVFFASGAAAARTVTVRENAGGTYRLSKGCALVATFAVAEQKKNLVRYSVTPQRAGVCSVRFTDKKKHGATLAITVTTTSIALAGSSVGPHAASATAVLAGVSATSALASCAQGCTIAAPPSKPGSNAYVVTLYDAANGTGKMLASGTATATIAAGKVNVVAAAPQRIAANATFGSVPSATGGTPLSPASVSLAVSDADKDPITGTYSPPVVVTDDDASALPQGSYLNLNGGQAAQSITVSSSADAIALGYGGLAIPTAHITATVASTAIGQTQFAPAIAPVAYTGTNNGNRAIPEIDLYSTDPTKPGYSGAFSLTQTGWSTSPYLRSFAFVPSGTNNNCSSFAIVQTSSSPPTYSVNPIASPKPGLCTMMLTGASVSSSTPVLLTFTNTTRVPISARHSPSRH